jgi:hypothetical protein
MWAFLPAPTSSSLCGQFPRAVCRCGSLEHFAGAMRCLLKDCSCLPRECSLTSLGLLTDPSFHCILHLVLFLMTFIASIGYFQGVSLEFTRVRNSFSVEGLDFGCIGVSEQDAMVKMIVFRIYVMDYHGSQRAGIVDPRIRKISNFLANQFYAKLPNILLIYSN